MKKTYTLNIYLFFITIITIKYLDLYQINLELKGTMILLSKITFFTNIL